MLETIREFALERLEESARPRVEHVAGPAGRDPGLSADEDARDEPVKQPTALLAYRDAEHEVLVGQAGRGAAEPAQRLVGVGAGVARVVGADVERCFTRDELLTNVMIYWLTGTIGSSMQYYWAHRHAPSVAHW